MKIILEGEFTTLNQYVEAERGNRYAGAKIKENETNRVSWEVYNQKDQKVTQYPIDVTLFWYCKNRRQDPDNIAFAVKFILDGLQLGEIIENDGWKQINSISHVFKVDRKNPRVEVYLDYIGDSDK